MYDHKERAVDCLIRYEAERRGHVLIEENGKVCWRHPAKDAYWFKVRYDNITLYMEIPFVTVEDLPLVLHVLFSTKVVF